MTKGAFIKCCWGMGRIYEKMGGRSEKEEVKGGVRKSKCPGGGGYLKI